MKIRYLFVLALLSFLLQGARRTSTEEVRAVWVTRYDYRTALDVSSIIVNCAKAGMTDVFFQVRGNGTAFYPSRVEPWAFELTGKVAAATGTNPGWDPLQMAVSWAKRYHIRLHAYINVMPGWRGTALPPRAAGQLWTAHPEWFMVDSTGARMQPTGGLYSYLNPAHPQVRAHLTQIAVELSRYDIAGLHLDYIRFPYDYAAVKAYPKASPQELIAHSTFSFDPVSLAMMKAQRGAPISRKKWDAFRRASISRVVADLGQVFKSFRGERAVLSASVLADFDDGYRRAYQDSRSWAKRGTVDWLIPMNYNALQFDARLKKIQKALGRRTMKSRVVMGIYCTGDAQQIRQQIAASRRAGCRGFALFAYGQLFEGHQSTKKGMSVR